MHIILGIIVFLIFLGCAPKLFKWLLLIDVVALMLYYIGLRICTLIIGASKGGARSGALGHPDDVCCSSHRSSRHPLWPHRCTTEPKTCRGASSRLSFHKTALQAVTASDASKLMFRFLADSSHSECHCCTS